MWFWDENELRGYVFRLRLEPLTLGHYFLLNEIDSPLVTDGETGITVSDISLAVLICSLPFRDSKRALSSRGIAWFMRAWAWRVRKLDIKKEIDSFKAYLERNLKTPRTKRAATNSDKCIGTPFAWRILVAILKLGFSEKDALEMTMRKAVAIYIASLEDQDRITLMNARENALVDYAIAERENN